MSKTLDFIVCLQTIADRKPELIAAFSSYLDALSFATSIAEKFAGMFAGTIVSLAVYGPRGIVLDFTERSEKPA